MGIKSAVRRARLEQKRRRRNRTLKTAIKNAIKEVERLILRQERKEEIEERLNRAFSLLDKAVSKGVIHKNTASRKKSALTRKASPFLRA